MSENQKVRNELIHLILALEEYVLNENQLRKKYERNNTFRTSLAHYIGLNEAKKSTFLNKNGKLKPYNTISRELEKLIRSDFAKHFQESSHGVLSGEDIDDFLRNFIPNGRRGRDGKKKPLNMWNENWHGEGWVNNWGEGNRSWLHGSNLPRSSGNTVAPSFKKAAIKIQRFIRRRIEEKLNQLEEEATDLSNIDIQLNRLEENLRKNEKLNNVVKIGEQYINILNIFLQRTEEVKNKFTYLPDRDQLYTKIIESVNSYLKQIQIYKQQLNTILRQISNKHIRYSQINSILLKIEALEVQIQNVKSEIETKHKNVKRRRAAFQRAVKEIENSNNENNETPHTISPSNPPPSPPQILNRRVYPEVGVNPTEPLPPMPPNSQFTSKPTQRKGFSILPHSTRVAPSIGGRKKKKSKSRIAKKKSSNKVARS